MVKIASKYKRIKHWLDPERNLALFVIIFAIICTLLLLATNAASPNSSLDPERGSISGNINIGSDSTANRGGYVQFGASRTTIHVPTSIASDCSRDVQAELSSWLDGLPSHTTAVLGNNDCYLVEDQLVIKDKTDFVLRGNNSTIKRTLPNGLSGVSVNHNHVSLVRVSNVAINDIKIQGPKPDSEGYNSGREAQHGFNVSGVDNVTFSNVSVSQVWGDCFYFKEGNNGPSQNITIADSYCNQTGRHGVGVVGASDLLITDSVFQFNHRENFDFEPTGAAGQVANNITITGNTIGPGTQYMVSASEGSPEFKNFTFTQNTVHRRFTINLESASGGRRRGPVNISHNVSDVGTKNNAVVIKGFDNGKIENNNILFDGTNSAGNPTGIFLTLSSSSDFSIKNNVANGAKSLLVVDQYITGMCQLNNTPVVTSLPTCAN